VLGTYQLDRIRLGHLDIVPRLDSAGWLACPSIAILKPPMRAWLLSAWLYARKSTVARGAGVADVPIVNRRGLSLSAQSVKPPYQSAISCFLLTYAVLGESKETQFLARGGDMPRVLRLRHRDLASRVLFGLGLVLAGSGAGIAAVLAASSSWGARGTGGAVGGASGLVASLWIENVRGHREARASAVERRDLVLDPVIGAARHDRSVPGALLPTRPDAAPFRGRRADLAWLREWLENVDGHPVAGIAGPSGVGKTRLAVQFASTLPGSWVTGWLHAGCGATTLSAVRACADPALILVEDADIAKISQTCSMSWQRVMRPLRSGYHLVSVHALPESVKVHRRGA
jgi:hypothetical protein